MSNIFSKLRDFVGLNEPVDYDYEYDEMDGNTYTNLYPQAASGIAPAPQMGSPSTASTLSAFNAPDLSSNLSSPNPMNSVSPMTQSSNVIGLPGVGSASEVVVMEPRTFEEMPQAIQALRERKSVVLNLTIMDPDQAQRAVDFIAGGTYALDGHQERIGESIFLFTPNCVQVSTQAGVVHEAAPGMATRSSQASNGTPPSSWTTDFRTAQS
ncbi:MAG: cell division protein SepF [Oscillatoriales cyanobacterium]|jgi:cell division inhibitor SepF|nr:MAG: cell division protein SepF [Oscillatoriales cyanobacterium]